MNGTTTDWSAGVDSGMGVPVFDFNTVNIATPPLPLYSELPLPGDHCLTYAALDAEFKLLSTINMDLHRLGTKLANYDGNKDFESFICSESEDFSGFSFLQSIMSGAQQYVVSIRTLRMKLQSGRGLSQQQQQTTTGELLLTLGYDESDSESHSSTEELHHTLDSPTAFLVVSCFAQLIKFEEFVFSLFLSSQQESSKSVLGYREVHLAGVQILDNPLQGVLFVELVLVVLNQAMIILGIPSTWARKAQGPGLCSPPRYREMLNKELGGVEGLWSARPAKLVELASQMKSAMTNACLSEIYTC
jgi:hypothetical protein